jgi:2-dehydro-3-deoxygluconokinase
MCPGEIDWDDLFASTRPAWFHTGGVFAALGPSTAAVAMEAIEAARRHGACVSFDLNYRASLWGRHGHANRVRDVYEGIVNNVDLLIGNEGHFDICLGFTNPTASPEPDRHRALFNELSTAYPNLTILAATVRKEVSTSLHHWRAVGWSATDGYTETGDYRVEILDRVGSGDGFAAGLIAGLLDQQPFGASLEQGAAHSALVMTTPGDTSMATADEVRRVVSGAHPHIRR